MSVGIDIGSKTIKVVEIKYEGNTPVLKAAGIVGVKDVSIDKIQNDNEIAILAQTIKTLFQTAKISSKEVIVALPESLVFTRNVKFPPLTDQEIASAVKWQAEDIVPIPAKDAILQHIILERKDNAQPPEVSVLVVAAPRALVEKYIKILTAAGLTVVGAETELIALNRAMSIDSQTIMLIDFGAKSTDIAISKKGQLVFSRTIPTAGEALTRVIAQNLAVDPTQAEEYKKTYGLNESQIEGKVSQAITPVFKIIVEEIKKAINFYQSEEKGDTPNLIVLSGGSSGLPQVGSSLTKLVGTEVVIANPFAKVSVNPQVGQSLLPYAPLYSIAVGLAMKKE